jgi:hypothetical protein
MGGSYQLAIGCPLAFVLGDIPLDATALLATIYALQR